MTAYIVSGVENLTVNDGSTQSITINAADCINPITGGIGIKVVKISTTGTSNVTTLGYQTQSTTYTFVNPTNSVNPPSAGNGAEFTVSFNGIGLGYTDSNVTMTSPGQDYGVGDIVTIPGDGLGGGTPGNDLTLEVLTVDGAGAITSYIVVSGNKLWPQTYAGQTTLLPNTESFIQVSNNPTDGCYFTTDAPDGSVYFTPVTIV